MRLTFQWKLMLSYLLLTLVCGGVLMGYLYRRLDSNLISEIHRNQIAQTRLAATLLAQNTPSADLNMLVRSAGTAIESRVTLISSDGTVLADSGVAARDLALLENHLDRPEVRLAIQSGVGTAIRYSETIKSRMLYVAIPFISAGGNGYIRTALPLASLDRTKAELHAILGAAALAAVMLSFALSWLLATYTVRPLRSMVTAARRFGRGEFDERIQVTGNDEVSELAVVLNDMAADIRRNLDVMADEKNRLDGILRGMGEGVLVTDNAGTVQLVNPAFREMFSLEGAIEGSLFIEICRHPSLVKSFRTVVAGSLELHDELELLDPPRTLLTHWVPLNVEGELQGVVAVFHDISQIKRLEMVRSDFVANVSHELRTPISVISGYAETLATGHLCTADPVQAERFIGVIHSHAGRLAHLLDDILALSRLESSQLSLNISRIRLVDLLQSGSNLVEHVAAEKGVQVECLQGDSDMMIEGDEARLEQVLVNLLDNAVKYTSPGGRVTVSAHRHGSGVEIRVADTGIGIPEKDLQRIFERFYRVDNARSRELGGTGLGLAIVKHIVQLHGGEISVTSIPGKGSTFTVKLMPTQHPGS